MAVNAVVAEASVGPPRTHVRNPAQAQNCAGIQGLVFQDVNGDGVQNEGEPGLGGINIKIRNPKNKQVKKLTTNADGTYNLTQVKNGSRRVTVSVPSNFTATTARRVLVTVPVCKQIIFVLAPAASSAAIGTTYYLDCNAGNDANSGTSTSAAWKSLTKANKASL